MLQLIKRVKKPNSKMKNGVGESTDGNLKK